MQMASEVQHRNINSTIHLPLLSAQKGVWTAQKLDPLSARYNCGGYLEIIGQVNISLLEQAVEKVIAETEALRVHIIEDGDQLSQVIDAELKYPLKIIDMSKNENPENDARLWMKFDLAEPVDFNESLLINQALIKLAHDKFFFYLRYHHIVMDGFGQMLYWRRVAETYTALIKGAHCKANSFSSLESIVSEDATYYSSAQFTKDQSYWLEKIVDPPEQIRFSNRESTNTRGLLRCSSNLIPSFTEKLLTSSRHSGVRWSVILIAAVAAYIHRLTNIEDIILTLPTTSRLTSISRATPCMLANELPLRLRILTTTTWIELVKQVAENIGQVLTHQRYRGEVLQHKLKLLHNNQKAAGPVVNIISFDVLQFANHRVNFHHLSSGPVNDILIGFYGRSDGTELHVYFDANPELYSINELGTHHKRFLNFLEAFTTVNQSICLNKIDILFPEERKQLQQYNMTKKSYDLSKCLHELILEQARRTPEAIAIVMADRFMNYYDLIENANRLADYMQKRGIKSGDFIGVYEVRSLELVVSLLAILMVGAAYVPLDPKLPLTRIGFQLSDANVNLVLSNSNLIKQLKDFDIEVLAVDTLLSSLPLAKRIKSLTTPESPAYVIYTSGSTGQPKGVVIPHRGIVNRLLWMQEGHHLSQNECVLQKTPFTFDVSVWEFFWPLITGNRLFLADPEMHRDPRYLAKIIREQNVTIAHFVPTMLHLFLLEPEVTKITSLRCVISSGEALQPETVRLFFDLFKLNKSKVNLYNLYGPTEASIDVTCWNCHHEDATDSIPIGYPIANTHIYLLNKSGEPVPIGMPGELYIGGVQVALGYLGRPELNQQRFVPDPFTQGTMYRTGDLGRYRTDGAIEFLGRLDHQVKIRGFRIELGEIELVLQSHICVEQAIVTVLNHAITDRCLVAYIVPRASMNIDQEELINFLAKQLPAYMIPAHIIVLDALPLLSNGKLDRKSLPQPSSKPEIIKNESMTVHEQLLHQVWCEILALKNIGIDDSFFALGGDSMLCIRVRASIEKYGKTFNIQDLFQFPTIRELAKKIQPINDKAVGQYSQSKLFSMLRPEDRAYLPDDVIDAYPLSAMQSSMISQAEFDQESAVYRVVTSLKIALKYNKNALLKAITDTFHRHPALRTSFDLSHYSEPLQLVHRTVQVSITEAGDLSHLDKQSQQYAIQDWINTSKFHHFNVEATPLVIFTVHQCNTHCFQLSVIEHHAVLDGWSDIVMLDEIILRYRAQLAGEDLWLPNLSSTYSAYIAVEKRVIANEESRKFWMNQLQDIEPTSLPRKNYYLEEKNHFNHRAIEVPIDVEVVKQIQLIAKRERLPLKSLLIAAHLVVLRIVCNVDEITTGIIFNGRLEEENGDEVIGVFLNTLPLRVDVRGHSLISIARVVFEHEKCSIRHGRYPFVQMQRDLGGQLQLDSYVNFMDFHRQWNNEDKNDNVVLDAIGVAYTNFTLAVNFLMDPVKEQLRLWLDCNIAVLESEFCDRLASYYQRSLIAISTSYQMDIVSLNLLGQEELSQIKKWNSTKIYFDKTLTIHQLLEQQALRNPEAIAIAYQLTEFNYSEVNARSNQLAHHLQKLGLQKGGLVGVSLKRSPNLIIALLAVLKAGGAYLPLDPTFPLNRLEFIAADSNVQYLITESYYHQQIFKGQVILLDIDDEAICKQSTALVDSDISGEDIAYVIYTSGSTGLPKGTIILHRNVINFFTGMNNRIHCTNKDVMLAVTSVSFDISVLELLWPLTCGAKVVIAPENLINCLVSTKTSSNESLTFSDLCNQHHITLFQGTPSLLSLVATEPIALSSLQTTRALLVGGEVFPSGLAKRLLHGLAKTRIFNMYGPTETTIWSTVYELDRTRDDKNDLIPIGSPIANTEVLILNSSKQQVPIGVAGELWIGGDGVACFYLGRPELSKERFQPHPEGHGFLYRTGDRARWNVEGSLELLGRIDRQVKILGNRIEPDEIESVLSLYPQVASVAVIANHKNTSLVELIAYVSPQDEVVDGIVENAHVQHWNEIWEHAYTDGRKDDFTGWLSSYTNKPILLAEMQEWLLHTVDKIVLLHPRNLIDVGVGVGLVLRNLISKVESYLGIDVSETAIQNAVASLKKSELKHATFIHGDAHNLKKVASHSADTIVINSVIQYFPNLNYLEKTLQESFRIVGKNGAVFVGDVRHFDLLEAFHADVQLHRAQPLMTAKEIIKLIKQQITAERELCLSPDFFYQLTKKIDAIGEVQIELKRGYALNELTCFRYDVLLLGKERTDVAINHNEIIHWAYLSETLSNISHLLMQTTHMGSIKIVGIPNRRLIRSLALVKLLGEVAETTTAWELERLLWDIDDTSAINPEEIVALAKKMKRQVRLLFPINGSLDKFDVVFGPREQKDEF